MTMVSAGGNRPLEAHKRPCDLRRHVGLIGDNPPSKRIYSLWGVIGFMALKILVCFGKKNRARVTKPATRKKAVVHSNPLNDLADNP